MSFSPFTGVQNAVQTMVARYKGEQREQLYDLPYFMGMGLTVVLGVIATILIYLNIPFLVGFF